MSDQVFHLAALIAFGAAYHAWSSNGWLNKFHKAAMLGMAGFSAVLVAKDWLV